MLDRRVVRIALMRSTIFLVTARDAWVLRPLIQVVQDRMFEGQFGRRLDGLDRAAVLAAGRAFLEVEPQSFSALGRHLAARWPERAISRSRCSSAPACHSSRCRRAACGGGVAR